MKEINTQLKDIKSSLMERGYSENDAWIAAYDCLVKEGKLTDYHAYGYTNKEETEDYLYIFAHSTENNQDYTYLSAKYRNGYFNISIGLYDKFYTELVDLINKQFKDSEIKSDMLNGLAELFNRICADYIQQIDDEITDRLSIREVPEEDRFLYKERMVHGINEMFIDNELKNIKLDLIEDDNAATTIAKYTTIHTTKPSMTIEQVLNKYDGSSVIFMN